MRRKMVVKQVEAIGPVQRGETKARLDVCGFC